jgi:hypothetical protein
VRTLLPVLFALCAALSNSVATVLQRKAALSVPRSDGLRAGLMLDLLRRPVWLAGILAVIAAAVCQALARAACLGTATAISYALTAALMKASMHILDDQGIVSFFAAWQTYAFALAGVAALTLYEEHVRSGWWLLPQLLGLALIALGAVALSRIPLTQSVVAPDETRKSTEAP